MTESMEKRIFTSIEIAHSKHYEKFFKISVDNSSNYFIPKLYLQNSSTNENQFITSENFTTIFMERLGLLGVHDSQLYEQFGDTNGLKYIFKCYSELKSVDCRVTLTKAPPKGFMMHCENLCFSFAGSLLTEPDIFLFGSSAENDLHSLISDPLFPSFLCGVYENLNTDVDMTHLYSMILKNMFLELRKISDQDNILNPAYATFADLLMFYAVKEPFSQILADSPYWLGNWSQIFNRSRLEVDTILGQMLKPSLFAKDVSGKLIYFQGINPGEEFYSATVTLIPALDKYLKKISSVLQKLLTKATMRPKVLLWFHLLAKSNANRGKIGAVFQNQQRYSSMGLCVNASLVALHILTPMEKNIPLLAVRMDLDYVKVPQKIKDSVIGDFPLVFDDPPMIPKPTQNEQESLTEPIEKKFSFQTEWLFLTMVVIRNCFIPVFKEYLKLEAYFSENPEVAWNAADLHSVQHRALLFAQRTLFTDLTLLGSIKKYAKIVAELLLYKINPAFLGESKEFDNKSINVDIIGEGTVDFLQHLPDSFLLDASYLFECVVSFYIEKSRESVSEFLPILLLVAILMGKKSLLHNPHHRAEIAKHMGGVVIFYTNQHKNSGLSFMEEVLCEKSIMTSALQYFLPESLIQIFIDIEFTGGSEVFYQKFSYRHSMYVLLKHICQNPNMRARLIKIAMETKAPNSEKMPLFLYFINLLTNDTIYLMDESMTMLIKIKEFEFRQETDEFKHLQNNEREAELQKYHKDRSVCQQYNTLAYKNIVQLKRITKVVMAPFVDVVMIDKISAMLNYLYNQFVSSKQSQLKVSKMNELKFCPRKVLFALSKIYRNLSCNRLFLESVASEGRSYSPEMFEKAVKILKSLQCKYNLVQSIQMVYMETKSIFMNKKLSNIDMQDCPEEFIDIISCELMLDPVLLPTSNIILDRKTIIKQLLSNEEDPFNRKHLTIDMIIPQSDLKERIKEWLKLKSTEN